MKWINKKDKKWNCEHVNKNDILMEKNGDLFTYNTDWPEPEDHYKYVFLNDLFEDYDIKFRDYIRCNCKSSKSE